MGERLRERGERFVFEKERMSETEQEKRNRKKKEILF